MTDYMKEAEKILNGEKSKCTNGYCADNSHRSCFEKDIATALSQAEQRGYLAGLAAAEEALTKSAKEIRANESDELARTMLSLLWNSGVQTIRSLRDQEEKPNPPEGE